ncbi:MAG: putative transport protein HsrA [Paracidovorax wautersii]|uniref:Putative transport protein HsrA n=1 Tax=Paracidovorax wautersii TaxID=1177982 RepID=A0A7V8FRG5_9BURK|nr:MAG: putative transport protein HsrA [Paracidovorax wautersii]
MTARSPCLTPTAADLLAAPAPARPVANPPALSQAGLFVLLAGLLLPLIDFSIVNVALDAMAQSLHTGPAELELVVAAYGLAFAVGLATGGRLGDRWGRRRVFTWGVAGFGLASALCGAAHASWLLMAARVLQGATAALIVPQVLGGLLVTSDLWGMGWRSVFLINLPICVAVLLLLRRHVPETRRAQSATLDGPGTAWLGLLIVCLLVPLLAAPAVALVLWRVELAQAGRGRDPLLPPALLRLPSVRFGMLVAALFFASWGGFMFVMALALQAGAGLSPLQAGNSFIVPGLAYFVASLGSARVAARIGHGPALLLGCLVQIVGVLGTLAALHWVWPHPGLANLALGMAVMGAGQALIVGSIWRIGLSDVPVEAAGAGGATISTVQQAAYGMGVALLGAVFAHGLHASGTGYLGAVSQALMVEVGLMLVLTACVAGYAWRRRGFPAK